MAVGSANKERRRVRQAGPSRSIKYPTGRSLVGWQGREGAGLAARAIEAIPDEDACLAGLVRGRMMKSERVTAV